MTDDLLDDIKVPASYLNELVGEGKKFKDLEALAYGKHESDVYIKTLERQLDQIKSDYTEARTELQSRAKFEELADRLAPRNREPVETKTEAKPEINLDQIKSLIATELKETETQRKQEENLKMVKTKLSEVFGDKLDSKLEELGIDGKRAAQVAKVNPQLLLKALGVGEQKPVEPGFQPPPRNAGFNQPIEQKRTWSYYQDLYKKDPKLKYDSKTNIQMQKDYISMGTAFEDGDFHRFG